jgi:hypothetical protein
MNHPPSSAEQDRFESPSSSPSFAPNSYAAGEVSEPILAEPAESSPPRRKRRKWLPLSLFLLTCVSTFYAGACGWLPMFYWEAAIVNPQDPDAGLMPMRQAMLRHWSDGLIYMACIIAILLTHEMGHFIATLWHRVPASLPYFVPFPPSPFGTMGAVIGMEGSRANRPQIFDIGLAGPLAGLVVAIPILLYGIEMLDLSGPEYGIVALDLPLVVKLAFEHWHSPPGYEPGDVVWMGQMNPYFMAGWVGLFITGLNMLPLSQLDGGHTIYTLFGRPWASWIARSFLVLAIAWAVFSDQWMNMWLIIALLLLIGPDHPPTRDDRAPLGAFRYVLGAVSLLIPVLCFPPRLMIQALP